jgi:hypothetical protein
MKKNLLLAFVFLLSLIGGGNTVLGQNVTVAALLDTAKIRIGEQARIDLFINYKTDQKNLNIQWPEIGDTLRKEVEVVNVSKIDTTIPDKNDPSTIQQHQTITVTSFDSGYWAIQPFIFVLNGDTSKPFETNALLLEVQTLPVDTAEASIKDIKGTLDEPTDWKEYLPYVYWGLGIIAALILIIYLYKKLMKKQPKPVEPPKPAEPPHVTAIRELEKIREHKLWQEGKVKEYYTAITDVLRLYIEGRYGVMAMELTSDEIMSVMKSQVIDNVSKEKLGQILSLADFVKFAKAKPIDVEHELTLSNAFEFVRGTQRDEVINTNPTREI